ncbi:MAG: pentapeptide repeat-containing protein [Pseudomonadota bacterium]|nr:pentapeptide repeat-containing protein [Pseudomonadota bacterium]
MEMNVKFQIKNRFSGAVLFETELSEKFAEETYAVKLGFAVTKALKARADLSEANLSWANLSKADLSKANLSKANLSKANLSKANLSEADLSKANLSKADLSWANLFKADLSKANLSEADLSWANLFKADLSKANLSEADLSKANLSVIKNDLIAEVLRLPNELDALRISIINGKIDGSTYSGKCACLAGTLAKANGQKDYNGDDFEVIQGIIFHSDAGSPREKWFTAIRSGDTPATNPVSKIALEWVDEAIAIRDFIRASAP